MPSLTVADLLTVGGLGIVVTLLIEIIKRGLAVSPEWVDRFGPALAAALGIVIGGATAVYLGAEVAQALLTGLLAGGASMGLSDLVGSVGKPSL